MSREKEELIERLANAVLELDEDLTKELSQEVINQGFDAWEAIEQGLLLGINQAGKLFDEEEYFVPELLIAADAMYAGLKILRPHIKNHDAGHGRKEIINAIVDQAKHGLLHNYCFPKTPKPRHT